MKIDLAVYTAIHGYDWQPGTVYATSDLVRYKRGIGRLPDPLMEELPFGGVFNDGDTVVFYRYHMAIKSDAKGRDSLYLVLGTLPKSEVSKVDFKYLFAIPEFSKPLKPAPVAATYIGSAATGSPPDFSASFRRCLRGEEALSEIGNWFFRVPAGVLSMRITGTYSDPVINVLYDKPRAEEPKAPSSVMHEMSPHLLMPNSQAGFSGYNSGTRFMPQQQVASAYPPRQSLFLPVIAALLTGAVVGWYARSAKDWIYDMVKAVQESRLHNNPTAQQPEPAKRPAEPNVPPNKDAADVSIPTNTPPIYSSRDGQAGCSEYDVSTGAEDSHRYYKAKEK